MSEIHGEIGDYPLHRISSLNMVQIMRDLPQRIYENTAGARWEMVVKPFQSPEQHVAMLDNPHIIAVCHTGRNEELDTSTYILTALGEIFEFDRKGNLRPGKIELDILSALLNVIPEFDDWHLIYTSSPQTDLESHFQDTIDETVRRYWSLMAGIPVS